MSETRLPSDPGDAEHDADRPAGGSEGVGAAIFSARSAERASTPLLAWGVAGLVVLAVLAVLLIAGRRHGGAALNAVLPADPDAAQLELSGLAMSESTSLSGGKSTFLDGHIRNLGTRTVTGVTVQVMFHNEENLTPQVETLPLALIRTREPYVDTQPISAAPLKPGSEAEFRLIFETIAANWNQQMPEVRVVRIASR